MGDAVSLPKLGFSRVDVPLPAQNPADLAAAIERLQEEAVIARSIETSLTVEVERLRANAEARERVMRREGNNLRAAEREREDLRREVERLRDERRIDNEGLAQACDFARNRGQALERQAVVAHLRAQAEMAYDNTDAHHALWLAAETVERGEHRREEKP